jgi:hypothetical protein
MSIERLEEYIASADLDSINTLLGRDRALASKKTSLKVSPLMLSCYYKSRRLLICC